MEKKGIDMGLVDTKDNVHKNKHGHGRRINKEIDK